MKRRALLVAGGAWLASAAARSFAQTALPRRIGFVHPGIQAGYRSYFDIFRTALKELGYVEGKDIAIDVRWADGRIDRLDALAAEIVALNPSVIVTGSSAGVTACKKATSSIPIVFTTAGSPVERGFVSSLRRPGGNITGITVHAELYGKIVEIAHQALPVARRFALLVHDRDPVHKAMVESFELKTRGFNLEPVVIRISQADELGRAFTELSQRKSDALIVPNLVLLTSIRSQLVERARKARLPLVSLNALIAEAGGLLSYGTRTEENWQRAAAMVDKILRGAKPADLPVEQPERFQLIVNMKTAKAIGVSLSPTTMLRADKIIE